MKNKPNWTIAKLERQSRKLGKKTGGELTARYGLIALHGPPSK